MDLTVSGHHLQLKPCNRQQSTPVKLNRIKINSKKLPSDFFTNKKTNLPQGQDSGRSTTHQSYERLKKDNHTTSITSNHDQLQHSNQILIQNIQNLMTQTKLLKTRSEQTGNQNQINLIEFQNKGSQGLGNLKCQSAKKEEEFYLTFARNIKSQEIQANHQFHSNKRETYDGSDKFHGKVNKISLMNNDWKKLLTIKRKLLNVNRDSQILGFRNSLECKTAALPPIYALKGRI